MSRTLKFRLPILGADLESELPVPGGSASLGGVMAPARRLSSLAMGHAESVLAGRGQKVSCKPGCDACCYQLIPVSVPEMIALEAAIAKLPGPRQAAIKKRFAAALARLEAAGLILPKGDQARTGLVSTASSDATSQWNEVSEAYFNLDLACPLLENGRCSVYDDRPFVCREFMVVSAPEHCEKLDASVKPVPRPVYMTRALADVAGELEGHSLVTLPLPLMLEWLAAHKDELESGHPGELLLETLLDVIEWNVEMV